MNVAAIKQIVPYAKFLVRAAREKRQYRHDTLPSPARNA
jgi:hypothetical protein